MSILFLTYCYPPLKYPRSAQISHLVQHLKADMSIKVITSEPLKNRDESLLNFTPLENVIVAKRSWKTKFIENIKGYKIKKALLPDFEYPWSFDLYHVALQEVKASHYQNIVTFGQPMSSHLVGLKLKRRFPKLKWIAHFSDPWVDNPYNEYNGWVKFINKIQQDRVFNLADKLLFTSPETIDLVMKHYSNNVSKKALYLPHSFNAKLYRTADINGIKSENFTLRYLGNFYGPRKPEPLFKAIQYLKEKLKNSNIIVELIGAENSVNNLIRQYQIENLVCVKPKISYLNSLALMGHTDLLIIIDAPAKLNVFFPSKLVDYIGANRPIFGITPPGASQRIIESLGFFTAPPDDPVTIANKLLQMIELIKENKIHMNLDIRNKYSIDRVGESLRNILHN